MGRQGGMMTTNNALNQASEVMTIGPIGTVPDGGTLLTVRKGQAGTTAIGILNETNNASSQVFLNLKQQLNNSGSPYLSTAGIGVVNDQAASNVYAGYLVVQNETGDPSTGTRGLVLWDANSAGTVKVGVGPPASAVDQAVWTPTGGQYRGKNTNTAPPAGYIGELISATATTGTLTSNTAANVTSVSLTAGNWDVYGSCAFNTSGTVAGNTDWDAVISATTASLTPTGENGATQDGGVGHLPVSGVNAVTLKSGPTRVSIASTTTIYLNCRGFASVTFTNVTCTGIIRAVRVG